MDHPNYTVVESHRFYFQLRKPENLYEFLSFWQMEFQIDQLQRKWYLLQTSPGLLRISGPNTIYLNMPTTFTTYM